MPELRLQVPQSFIDEINRKLKRINESDSFNLSLNDIGREALTRLQWTVDQIEDGKAIVATDQSKTDMVQLGTPAIPARRPKR